MDASPDDIAAKSALEKLSLCTWCLERFRIAIRSLLDDIHIAEWNSEINQKTMLWVNGRYTIDWLISELQTKTNDAETFMWNDDFDDLDSIRRGEYFDALRKIDKDTKKLQKQYTYYTILGNIEYREATIRELDSILKRSYHYVTYRKWVGALRRRWLTMHKRRIKNLEQRICYECMMTIRTIEQAISHPLFRDISVEKRDYYHSRWKHYQDELWAK